MERKLPDVVAIGARAPGRLLQGDAAKGSAQIGSMPRLPVVSAVELVNELRDGRQSQVCPTERMRPDVDQTARSRSPARSRVSSRLAKQNRTTGPDSAVWKNGDNGMAATPCSRTRRCTNALSASSVMLE